MSEHILIEYNKLNKGELFSLEPQDKKIYFKEKELVLTDINNIKKLANILNHNEKVIYDFFYTLTHLFEVDIPYIYDNKDDSDLLPYINSINNIYKFFKDLKNYNVLFKMEVGHKFGSYSENNNNIYNFIEANKLLLTALIKLDNLYTKFIELKHY